MAWMLLMPLLLWVLLAFGMFAFSSWLVALVGEWWTGVLGVTVPVPDHTGWQGFWDDVKSFFSGTGAVVALVVIKVALFLLLALVNKYVVLIVLSPTPGLCSKLTETNHGPHLPLQPVAAGEGHRSRYPHRVTQRLPGAVDHTAGVDGHLFHAPADPSSVVALFLVSAYFYGFSMFDYAFERRRMRVGESVRAVNGHLGMVLANGALFSLLGELLDRGPGLRAADGCGGGHARTGGEGRPNRRSTHPVGRPCAHCSCSRSCASACP